MPTFLRQFLAVSLALSLGFPGGLAHAFEPSAPRLPGRSRLAPIFTSQALVPAAAAATFFGTYYAAAHSVVHQTYQNLNDPIAVSALLGLGIALGSLEKVDEPSPSKEERKKILEI